MLRGAEGVLTHIVKSGTMPERVDLNPLLSSGPKIEVLMLSMTEHQEATALTYCFNAVASFHMAAIAQSCFALSSHFVAKSCLPHSLLMLICAVDAVSTTVAGLRCTVAAVYVEAAKGRSKGSTQSAVHAL